MKTRPMSRDEVREVDRRAIEEFGLPGVVLMENAGRGCAELLVSLGVLGKVVICAGKGNNAGDGFVIARHLENRGIVVEVFLFCRPEELRGDAAINFRVIEKSGTPIRECDATLTADEMSMLFHGVGWIVDALLGTGARGKIREPFAPVIHCINQASARVFAVDLPSGMDCDTGVPLTATGSNELGKGCCCVRADHTATFVARKMGFDARGAEEFTGKVHVIDIGVPRWILEAGKR